MREMTPPAKTRQSRARASSTDLTPPAKGERIQQIVDLMVSGLWVTGKSGPELAKSWGLAVNTVERDSAEASRHIQSLMNPQERAERKAIFLAKLEGAQSAALKAGEYSAAARFMELEGKTLGHFEPEKVELSGNLGDLLQLGLTSDSEETG